MLGADKLLVIRSYQLHRYVDQTNCSKMMTPQQPTANTNHHGRPGEAWPGTIA